MRAGTWAGARGQRWHRLALRAAAAASGRPSRLCPALPRLCPGPGALSRPCPGSIPALSLWGGGGHSLGPGGPVPPRGPALPLPGASLSQLKNSTAFEEKSNCSAHSTVREQRARTAATCLNVPKSHFIIPRSFLPREAVADPSLLFKATSDGALSDLV